MDEAYVTFFRLHVFDDHVVFKTDELYFLLVLFILKQVVVLSDIVNLGDQRFLAQTDKIRLDAVCLAGNSVKHSDLLFVSWDLGSRIWVSSVSLKELIQSCHLRAPCP